MDGDTFDPDPRSVHGVVVIFLYCDLNRFPIFNLKVLNSKPYLVYSVSKYLQDAIIYIARRSLVTVNVDIFACINFREFAEKHNFGGI